MIILALLSMLILGALAISTVVVPKPQVMPIKVKNKH